MGAGTQADNMKLVFVVLMDVMDIIVDVATEAAESNSNPAPSIFLNFPPPRLLHCHIRKPLAPAEPCRQPLQKSCCVVR